MTTPIIRISKPTIELEVVGFDVGEKDSASLIKVGFRRHSRTESKSFMRLLNF